MLLALFGAWAVVTMTMEAANRLHKTAEVNGVELHYVQQGEGPLILFLHGFPEFWYAWKDSLAEFGRDHRAVAVDMRGYNLSSKPAAVEEYRMERLVADVADLIRDLGAERAVTVGHDWGGAVGWALAMAHPEMLERLVIINASHPAVFARELTNNPQQQKASGYMRLLMSPEAETVLSAGNYAALRQFFASEAFTPQDREQYLVSWKQPGALTGALNYYRANLGRLVGSAAARRETTTSTEPLPQFPVIEVPTLVIWGEQDPALLTGNLVGLEEHVREIEIQRIPTGTHWVVHEQPETIHRLIREFLRRSEP